MIGCVLLGALAAGPVGWVRSAGLSYAATGAVLTEADPLVRAINRALGVPVDRYDPALSDAVLFEDVIQREAVIVAAFEQVEDVGQALRGFGITGDLDSAETRAMIAEVVRKRTLALDYEPRSPKIEVTVRGPTEEFTRQFARRLVERAAQEYETHKERARSATARRLIKRRNELAKEVETAEAGDGTSASDETASADLAVKRRLLQKLTQLEESHRLNEEIGRPAITVLSVPILAPARVSSWGPAFMAATIGSFLGLAVGLSWIAFGIHVETMRGLNPELYGKKQ